MSTLAETYALQIGVPLSYATIQETFFPLDHPLDKTILIHGFGGKLIQNGNQLHPSFGSKVYDHFSEVVDIIKPIVEPLGYKIFQIGGPNEPAIKGIEVLCGRTTMLQCAYLVRRAALLIANDSQWSHIRGAFHKPMVSVYGPTSSWVHGPYWRDPEKTILIDSHRFGKKRPSYQSQEHPKTINVIPPEDVANAALSILDAPQVSRRSLFIGQLYHQPIIELIPNVIIDPKVPLNVAPIIRMDYHFDVNVLAGNLRIRKASIITDKEIDLNILAQLKPNITSIRVEIDKISPEWIKNMKKLGIPAAFVCLEKDEKKVEKMRLDYYDATLFDRFVAPTVEDFREAVKAFTQEELDPAIKLDTLSFKVNKFLLSEGKVYLSEAHWRRGLNTPNTETNVGKVIDEPAFWTDKEHYFIFQENPPTS